MIWEVTGWRILYDIGVRERWYEGTDKNPISSVFYSNFEDFVEKCSIRNGR